MARETGQRAMTESDFHLDQATGPTIDFTRLYRLWEEHNWSALGLDFTTDSHDWHERFTPTQRRAARWNYALFLHGEDAVARTLAPFVTAAPTQEQRIFLTTQIVDEARHHVFFSRFMREVAGDGHDYVSTLEAARPDLTRGFRQVFDELDRLTDKLRRHPRDLVLYAQCVALYHIVIEGLLAHPGQHFIRTYLAATRLLPGFSEGMANIARDEARHMAFGLQVVKDLITSSPRAREAVIALLERVLPWTLAVFVPPNFDHDYVRVFDFELRDIYAFGLRSLEAKLTRIGIAPTEIVSLVQTAVDAPVEEQARRSLVLLEAGVIGDTVPLQVNDEVLALLFDGMERVANMRPPRDLPGPIQWAFTNARPWYLAVEDARVIVHQGSASAPALTLRCDVEDWARIAGRKLDARWALLTRRLRLEGERRLALRLPALLGA
ncbi:MAG: ribonucleotide-diphosphate reductase subunit beta [Ktedonobacterales bacterium]|nr:ribonucleotide-diphosphate reductase subunit beta [Ktedonobacterales bacterium]